VRRRVPAICEEASYLASFLSVFLFWTGRMLKKSEVHGTSGNRLA
jgi:hypothetical protein